MEQQPLKVEVMAPESSALLGPANAAYMDAVEVSIDCDAMRDVAVEERTVIRTRWSALEDLRKRLKKPFIDGGAQVDAIFKPAQDRLEAAREVLDRAILTYNAAQEQKAREERARLEVAAAAERKRAEEEARRQHEEAERLANMAAQAASAEDAERLTAAAEAAEQEAAAQAVVAETITAPAVVVETKMTGASTRKTVDYKIIDMAAFIRWVAAQLNSAPHLANLLTEDSVKLRAFVKTYGADQDDGKSQIPGVKIFEKGSIASRRAA